MDQILKSIKSYCYVYDQKHDIYWNNASFVLKAVYEDGNMIKYVSEILMNDKKFILKALKINTYVFFKRLSEEFRNDKEIVFEALKNYPWVLNYLSEEFRNDKEFVLLALKSDPWVLVSASQELQNNKDFILEAIKIQGRTLEYTSPEMKSNKKLRIAAIKKIYFFDFIKFKKDNHIIQFGRKIILDSFLNTLEFY